MHFDSDENDCHQHEPGAVPWPRLIHPSMNFGQILTAIVLAIVLAFIAWALSAPVMPEDEPDNVDTADTVPPDEKKQ
jgi:hypothetical protein